MYVNRIDKAEKKYVGMHLSLLKHAAILDHLQLFIDKVKRDWTVDGKDFKLALKKNNTSDVDDSNRLGPIVKLMLAVKFRYPSLVD